MRFLMRYQPMTMSTQMPRNNRIVGLPMSSANHMPTMTMEATTRKPTIATILIRARIHWGTGFSPMNSRA
ncbi:hypothetical protein [Streptomyces luteogriseus]|uniref:hypothetical protein n=1 Tax=Streptomyces luteogriseus TaxID=68233 RepID=UPI0037B8453C